MKKILEFFLGKSRNKQIVDLVGLDRIELSRDLKVQANQAVAQGRWDEAAQLYEKAILANSADASLLVGLGFSHLQAVRPKQALATLLQAIRVLPNSQDAWFLAGKARSEEHTSELQSQSNLVCRLLLEKKKRTN